MSNMDRKDRQPSPSSSRGNVVDHDAPPGKTLFHKNTAPSMFQSGLLPPSLASKNPI